MNSLRKWIFRPKRSDKAQLARFYYADEELNAVAAELDSFDGRKDPERCTSLVNQLRHCQDALLSIVDSIMSETIPEGQRATRDFRVKFPDDVLQESLAGQLWFGAECLAAGSSILNREVESASMRPLARLLTNQLDLLRTQLREQALRNQHSYTDKICEALIAFDRVFAEFELSYVSAMVPVKTMREYDLLQEVTVLFCETVQRALRLELLTRDMIESYDPALMFTIPRLAIVCGLLVYPEGPINPDQDPTTMSEMFRPFQTLLHKIRELLWTLTKDELWLLEQALCSAEEPKAPSAAPGGAAPPTTPPTPHCPPGYFDDQLAPPRTLRPWWGGGEVSGRGGVAPRWGARPAPEGADDEEEGVSDEEGGEGGCGRGVMVHSESTMTVVARDSQRDSQCGESRCLDDDADITTTEGGAERLRGVSGDQSGGAAGTMQPSGGGGRNYASGGVVRRSTVPDSSTNDAGSSCACEGGATGGATGGRQLNHSRSWPQGDGGASRGQRISPGGVVRAVRMSARVGSREFNFNLPHDTAAASMLGEGGAGGVPAAPLQRLIYISPPPAVEEGGESETGPRHQVAYITDTLYRLVHADLTFSSSDDDDDDEQKLDEDDNECAQRLDVNDDATTGRFISGTELMVDDLGCVSTVDMEARRTKEGEVRGSGAGFETISCKSAVFETIPCDCAVSQSDAVSLRGTVSGTGCGSGTVGAARDPADGRPDCLGVSDEELRSTTVESQINFLPKVGSDHQTFQSEHVSLEQKCKERNCVGCLALPDEVLCLREASQVIDGLAVHTALSGSAFGKLSVEDLESAHLNISDLDILTEKNRTTDELLFNESNSDMPTNEIMHIADAELIESSSLRAIGGSSGQPDVPQISLDTALSNDSANVASNPLGIEFRTQSVENVDVTNSVETAPAAAFAAVVLVHVPEPPRSSASSPYSEDSGDTPYAPDTSSYDYSSEGSGGGESDAEEGIACHRHYTEDGIGCHRDTEDGIGCHTHDTRSVLDKRPEDIADNSVDNSSTQGRAEAVAGSGDVVQSYAMSDFVVQPWTLVSSIEHAAAAAVHQQQQHSDSAEGGNVSTRCSIPMQDSLPVVEVCGGASGLEDGLHVADSTTAVDLDPCAVTQVVQPPAQTPLTPFTACQLPSAAQQDVPAGAVRQGVPTSAALSGGRRQGLATEAGSHRSYRLSINNKWPAKADLSPTGQPIVCEGKGVVEGACSVGGGGNQSGARRGRGEFPTNLELDWDRESYCSSSETSSYTSDCNDDKEIAMAIVAAETSARQEARSKFKSSADLIHRLFVCISGVADQLQTNYASDLRHILKVVFDCSTSRLDEPDMVLTNHASSMEEWEEPGDLDMSPVDEDSSGRRGWEGPNLEPLPAGGTVGDTTQQSANQTGEGGLPPRWVPDEQTLACMACRVAFTFVRRRHHCRSCGRIFCAHCSSNSVPLPLYGHNKPVRVCNHCFMFRVTPFTIHN